jgi:DNA-binding LacI/PurR family transcriptional regulator
MRSEKPVTIKDIAKRLKLHHSTVSKALHDHPSVSRATKELVLSMADELDFNPESIVRSSKKRKSNTIGVMIPDVRNPYFAQVLFGIEEEAYKSGYYIIVVQSHENHAREVLNVEAMITNQVCGVLVCISEQTEKGDHFEAFIRRNIPLVFFDRACQDLEQSKIVNNDYEGAFNVTEHLINLGYRRIAHIAGPQNLQISKNRLNGYLAALQEYEIPFDNSLVVYGSLNEEDGSKGCEQLCQADIRPDAIFAVNDPVAIGVYLHTMSIGLKIPNDIAVVGFGNIPVSALMEPPLTTIKQPSYDLGRLAAKVIIKQIENPKEMSTIRTEVIQTELIIRRSA